MVTLYPILAIFCKSKVVLKIQFYLKKNVKNMFVIPLKTKKPLSLNHTLFLWAIDYFLIRHSKKL